jgi:hypothetical protein
VNSPETVWITALEAAKKHKVSRAVIDYAGKHVPSRAIANVRGGKLRGYDSDALAKYLVQNLTPDEDRLPPPPEGDEWISRQDAAVLHADRFSSDYTLAKAAQRWGVPSAKITSRKGSTRRYFARQALAQAIIDHPPRNESRRPDQTISKQWNQWIAEAVPLSAVRRGGFQQLTYPLPWSAGNEHFFAGAIADLNRSRIAWLFTYTSSNELTLCRQAAAPITGRMPQSIRDVLDTFGGDSERRAAAMTERR